MTLKYGVKFEDIPQIKTLGQPPCANKGTHGHGEERKGVRRGGKFYSLRHVGCCWLKFAYDKIFYA